MWTAAGTCLGGFMAEPPDDRIHIRDLSVQCIIGINPEERVKKQEILISLTLYADLSEGARTDRLEDTVDYKSLKKDVRDCVEASEFFLLERLAEQVAEIALRPVQVQRVDVCVDKPGALRHARSVAVEITRMKTL